jgi:hypothetical protein
MKKKNKVDTPNKNSWANTVNKTPLSKPKTNCVFVRSITLDEYKKSIGMI